MTWGAGLSGNKKPIFSLSRICSQSWKTPRLPGPPEYDIIIQKVGEYCLPCGILGVWYDYCFFIHFTGKPCYCPSAIVWKENRDALPQRLGVLWDES